MAAKKPSTAKSSKNNLKTTTKTLNSNSLKKDKDKKVVASANKSNKKTVSSKKGTTTTKKVTVGKSKVNQVKTVTTKKIINGNKVKTIISKDITILWYSCIRKYYRIIDSKTKEETIKRMWIVIGDGHKWYRKFSTQAEAIVYFRALKKFAKMRVQSVKEPKFIKIVSTFRLLENSGVDVSSYDFSYQLQKISYENEDNEFVDEFSKYDDLDNQEEYDKVDLNEINDIILSKEKDVLFTEEVELDNEEGKEITYSKSYNPMIEIMELDSLFALKEKDDVKKEYELFLVNYPFETPSEEEIFNDLKMFDEISSKQLDDVENKNNEEPKYSEIEHVEPEIFKDPDYSEPLLPEEVVNPWLEDPIYVETNLIDQEVIFNEIINDPEPVIIEETIKEVKEDQQPEEKQDLALTNEEVKKGSVALYWTTIILISIILATIIALAIYYWLGK